MGAHRSERRLLSFLLLCKGGEKGIQGYMYFNLPGWTWATVKMNVEIASLYWNLDNTLSKVWERHFHQSSPPWHWRRKSERQTVKQSKAANTCHSGENTTVVALAFLFGWKPPGFGPWLTQEIPNLLSSQHGCTMGYLLAPVPLSKFHTFPLSPPGYLLHVVSLIFVMDLIMFLLFRFGKKTAIM